MEVKQSSTLKLISDLINEVEGLKKELNLRKFKEAFIVSKKQEVEMELKLYKQGYKKVTGENELLRGMLQTKMKFQTKG